MKAVVLLAGMGSRLGELTRTTPKSLLPVGGSVILDRMVRALAVHGVEEIVAVGGHRQDDLERHATAALAEHGITFVRNEDFASTNTAASLLCARELLDGASFVKLDGDVVFDGAILDCLLAAEPGSSYACVDRTDVDDEVIKVSCDAAGRILRIGNRVPVADAVGESIGIERIDARSSGALFEELASMAGDPAHRQSYYEVAYDAIVQAGERFGVVDVTGLAWVEVDTVADYQRAQALFGA